MSSLPMPDDGGESRGKFFTPQRGPVKDWGPHIQNLRRKFPNSPYKPEGHCSRCSRALEIDDIIENFRDDVTDTTSACSNCGRRLQPRLVGPPGVDGTDFWCKRQTIHKLTQLGVEVEWKTLLADWPQVVYSARFHFGSVTEAFKQGGLTYTKEPSS